MPAYHFRLTQEAIWFLANATFVYVCSFAITQSDWTDWKHWAPALAIGLFRTVGGLFFALTGPKVPTAQADPSMPGNLTVK